MNVHRIRLRGPWRYEWLSSDSPEPAASRVNLPSDWQDIFGNATGRVCFSRNFNCPSNLEPSTRLDLVFEGLGGEAEIFLNGQKLEPDADRSPVRCPITGLLEPAQNQIRVEIQFDPSDSDGPGGLWGPVVLEIREVPR